MSESMDFDVVVVGATAPGIVAAVRAAREGLRVALVATGRHLGGSLPSLGAVETHYRGVRAPLLQEFIEAVKDHYRTTYGAESEAYRACAGGKMIMFEPKIAERVLILMIEREANIRVFREGVPLRVERSGALISAVWIQQTEKELCLRAGAFVEATYEGDFMALAGAEFRVGREGRSEYGEPRAGRVFTQWLTGTYPREAVEGRLNLVTAGATTSEPLPGSTGEGDDNIQSYSYRLCLTNDPANRRLLETPPAGYDRERYAQILLSPEEKEKLPLPFHHRFQIYSLREMAERDHLFHGHALPNRKRSWNATNFTGAGKAYPTADQATRRAIAQRHLDHALGLMWFLQNDPAMPSDLRERAREWGLARDEFADHDNVPTQLYVREARRLVGRAVFTEHDALIATGASRAPIQVDAVAITDFSLDSLACTTERQPGTLCDGQLFQMEVSRPGQVSWGVLLPREIDNLVVVTTVSATHVGWGTVRQTPTLMHLAESAAWALVMAKRTRTPPAQIAVNYLQHLLVARGVMISFFNEFDMGRTEPWVAAAQWLGTRGFFDSYDSRPDDPVTDQDLSIWHACIVPLLRVRDANPGIFPREKLAGARTRAEAWKVFYDVLAGT